MKKVILFFTAAVMAVVLAGCSNATPRYYAARDGRIPYTYNDGMYGRNNAGTYNDGMYNRGTYNAGGGMYNNGGGTGMYNGGTGMYNGGAGAYGGGTGAYNAGTGMNTRGTNDVGIARDGNADGHRTHGIAPKTRSWNGAAPRAAIPTTSAAVKNKTPKAS